MYTGFGYRQQSKAKRTDRCTSNIVCTGFHLVEGHRLQIAEPDPARVELRLLDLQASRGGGAYAGMPGMAPRGS
jgi:hypothetical protein